MALESEFIRRYFGPTDVSTRRAVADLTRRAAADRLEPSTELGEGLNAAMSSELPRQNAEHALAERLVERMEKHIREFGAEETGFFMEHPEMLCVPVLQRAARMFWQRHPALWPRFAISGTGVSLEMRRIPRPRR